MSSPNIELTIALAAIAALTIHAILMVLAFYIFYRIFQDSLLLSASLRRLLDVAADHLQAIDKHIADGNPTAKPLAKQGHDTLKNSAVYKSRKPSVYVMAPKQHLRLREIGSDPSIHWSATLSRIVCETNRYLDRLARCVSECKSVDEAANFCRWLEFSGILQLPNDDFRIMRKKSEEIMWKVGEIYKGGKVKPTYSASDMDSLQSKVDLLLAKFSQVDKGTEPIVEAVCVSPALLRGGDDQRNAGGERAQRAAAGVSYT